MVENVTYLPEACIEAILSFTSPRDACRFSVISSTFKSASESEDLWKKFLLYSYNKGVRRRDSHPLRSSYKKLYFYLSDNPTLIGKGTHSFQIDKNTGKRSFMIGPKALVIPLRDDPHIWNWTEDNTSRFGQVPVLKCHGGLSLRGSILASMLSGNTTYAAYLVYKRKSKGIFDVASVASVKIMARDADYDFRGEERDVCFGLAGSKGENWIGDSRRQVESELHLPVMRRDGWMEVELGEFSTCEYDHRKVIMSIEARRSPSPSSGLIVQGFEVRPRRDH